MQLIRLEKLYLQKATKQKRDNGTIKETYRNIDFFYGIVEELVDEVSATVYGADINKTLRIRTNFNKLEKLLKTKVNNTSDNISLYFVLYDNKRYKVVSVKNNWIDISL